VSNDQHPGSLPFEGLVENPDALAEIAVPAPSNLTTPDEFGPDAGIFVPAITPNSSTWDGAVDPSISSAPATRVDTGRLYRSAGAEGVASMDAIPAIPILDTPAAHHAATAHRGTALVPAFAAAGLTFSGVVVVLTSATVLVGFADALLHGKVGILTGVALAISSLYAALLVRRVDIWAAVIVPPLAFLAATVTAGQLTLDKAGSLFVREGYTVVLALALNAPWIIGTTLICLVIVLIRRMRPEKA